MTADDCLPKRCSGVRKTWPWKGYPCGNPGKYELDGKNYCAAHYAVAVKDKEKRNDER